MTSEQERKPINSSNFCVLSGRPGGSPSRPPTDPSVPNSGTGLLGAFRGYKQGHINHENPHQARTPHRPPSVQAFASRASYAKIGPAKTGESRHHRDEGGIKTRWKHTKRSSRGAIVCAFPAGLKNAESRDAVSHRLHTSDRVNLDNRHRRQNPIVSKARKYPARVRRKNSIPPRGVDYLSPAGDRQ